MPCKKMHRSLINVKVDGTYINYYALRRKLIPWAEPVLKFDSRSVGQEISRF
jgi:hypothetical protein